MGMGEGGGPRGRERAASGRRGAPPRGPPPARGGGGAPRAPARGGRPDKVKRGDLRWKAAPRSKDRSLIVAEGREREGQK